MLLLWWKHWGGSGIVQRITDKAAWAMRRAVVDGIFSLLVYIFLWHNLDFPKQSVLPNRWSQLPYETWNVWQYRCWICWWMRTGLPLLFKWVPYYSGTWYWLVGVDIGRIALGRCVLGFSTRSRRIACGSENVVTFLRDRIIVKIS